jgi:hypothetical protein
VRESLKSSDVVRSAFDWRLCQRTSRGCACVRRVKSGVLNFECNKVTL